MQILKNKLFYAWCQKLAINDNCLCKAVREIQDGLSGVNLGGNLYKKRIATGGRGKSGGVRTILAFKLEDKAIFIYGFAKNKKDYKFKR